MQTSQPSLIAREDTLLGVCEALGEDFGFNANYLRVLFGVGLLWNPVAMVGAYLAAGVVVALSRWLIPNPSAVARSRRANERAPAESTPQEQGRMLNEKADADPLPVAA